MSEKKLSRLRRARRARAKIRELGTTRLSIHRTPRHIYAQVIAGDGSKVLASDSTLYKDLPRGKTGNADAPNAVGLLIA
jgi:large subunit ribosomal protein L18